MSTLHIVMATRDDLPAIHHLYTQLHGGTADTTLEAMASAFDAITVHPACAVYVATMDGVVIGTFTLYILPNMTRNGRPAALLENIVVDAAWRGRGIGRAMLESAREVAQAQGCYKLSLTSNAARAEAHAFYLRCGMTQHGISFRDTLS